METGGKRKLERNSIEILDDCIKNMSPKRKKAKLENNNSYNPECEGFSDGHLFEMGVSLLPSDEEEEVSSSEPHNQITSDKSDESSNDSTTHKSPEENFKPSETDLITPPDQLILSCRSRRSIKSSSKKDLFALLSDEIVLMILQWLPRHCLPECALVCHRWRRIVYDESLWQRIDLTAQSLQTDHMAYVLQRNPYILRMSQTEVSTPMFEEMVPAMESFTCQIQYLDLSMALITAPDLAELLNKCPCLKKLSVEHCVTDADVCSAIAANTDLEVLNMSQCYQLECTGLEEILVNCTELVELNLAWTRLDSKCFDSISNLVSNNIKKLNLSGGLKNLKDNHVEDLVSRCSCITDLDLSDCTDITGASLNYIIKHLCDIEELSVTRCYGISYECYAKLQKLKRLRYLNMYGLMQPKQVDIFRKTFKQFEVNKHEFSTIARPTVGIRRTSIWGMRVRD